jgi:hypothetical protein
MKSTNRICTYCGLHPGTTRDHVPPKGLFAGPRPKLVTVPCCETCRKAQPLDDEYFVRMVSMKSGLHETDSSRGARNAALRSLTKPTKQRFTLALLRSVNDVAVHSPTGIYLGQRLAYDVDLDRLSRVIERSTLGLHLEEFKTRLPEGHRCKAYALDGFANASPAQARNVRTLWGHATSGQRRDLGVNVFTYWFRQLEGPERATLWAFVVYGGLGFIATTAPTERLPK